MVSKQGFTQFFYVVHLKIHYIYTSNSTNQWFNTVIVVLKHMHMDREQIQRISSSSSITYLEFFFHFRNALSKIIKWLKFGFRHAWKIKY